MITLQRPKLADIVTRDFDVIVTGGGVYGACFAYEFASRGLQVLLVEKNDFGAAASANSLRIVHGGLRYLQKLDFRRARSSAMERSVLLRIFPGMVTPLLCALPTRPGLKSGRLAFAGGLALNALITWDRNRWLRGSQKLRAGGLAARGWLSRRCEPLKLDDYYGTAFWYDAFMQDPDRLLFSYLLAAASHGATLINHASVDRYLTHGDQMVGAVVTDRTTGESAELRAGLVVDCRSGWLATDSLFASAFRERQKIRYALGVNLVIDRQLCDCAVGFPSRHGRQTQRYFFMVPHDGKTMIGTWYLPVRSSPDDASTTNDERALIMDEIATAMPAARLSIDDIVSQQVGILPCTDYPGAEKDEPKPTEAPAIASGRDLGGPKGLWFVQGEKWTTARMTAAAVSTMIAKDAGKMLLESKTDRVPLSEGGSPMPDSWHTCDPSMERVLLRMWQRRGPQGLQIPGLADAAAHADHARILGAEARFSVEHEMAQTLGDIIRRLGLGQLECPDDLTLRSVAEAVHDLRGWSEADIESQIATVVADQRYSVRAKSEVKANP